MLAVNGLTVTYGGAEGNALNGVDLTVRAGERVALLGANGAGKSTLLLSLVGVLEASSGSVALNGTVLAKNTVNELRKQIGMVFQSPDDQLFMPTVYEDIAFGPRNFGQAEADIEPRMDAVLESLGIAHLKRRMAHRLSGGEKRLVALAGVLVMQPLLLLMDEPASFLDPRARRRLVAILEELPQAMILATHDLDMALALCGRAVVLQEGNVAADGPCRDILRDAAFLRDCGL